MARMKIEVLNQRFRKDRAISLRDMLVAHLPRNAPGAARLPFLFNLRNRSAALRRVGEVLFGISAHRRLPRWRRDYFRASEAHSMDSDAGRELVLLVDTFNTYFEPENARAALRVLEAAGHRVVCPPPVRGTRPLCCGRTFLSHGLVDDARYEARRLVDTLAPYAESGVPIVGLEPSCLLTLRDELPAILPGTAAAALADQALLLQEFLAREDAAGRLDLPLAPLPVHRVLVHGHCHEKAFAAMAPLVRVLGLVPRLEVELIDSGCCGMAGSFGYEAEHHELSMAMAELDLLPAARAAGQDTWLVADGTSCRQQIADGAAREARHVARVLDAALAG